MVFSFSVFFVASQRTAPSPRHFASLARIRRPLPAGRANSERKDSSIAAGNIRAKRY